MDSTHFLQCVKMIGEPASSHLQGGCEWHVPALLIHLSMFESLAVSSFRDTLGAIWRQLLTCPCRTDSRRQSHLLKPKVPPAVRWRRGYAFHHTSTIGQLHACLHVSTEGENISKCGNQTHNPACRDNHANRCYSKSEKKKKIKKKMIFRFSSGHGDGVGNSPRKRHIQIKQIVEKKKHAFHGIHCTCPFARELTENIGGTISVSNWNLWDCYFVFLINCWWSQIEMHEIFPASMADSICWLQNRIVISKKFR